MSKVLDLWADMTGVVLDYAFSTPPSPMWLMCYGQALPDGDAATARLRAKLLADGSPYGDDGAGNPLVPDARGRETAGKDDMGGSAAGRLTSAGAGINGAALGAVGGSQTHTLTTAQMPQHNHGVTDPGHAHGVSDPTHTHSVYDPGHTHTRMRPKARWMVAAERREQRPHFDNGNLAARPIPALACMLPAQALPSMPA